MTMSHSALSAAVYSLASAIPPPVMANVASFSGKSGLKQNGVLFSTRYWKVNLQAKIKRISVCYFSFIMF